MHLNIRSICNKFCSLKHLIESLHVNFHVIGLSETWLNDIYNTDNFQLDNYDFIVSNRTKKRGSGVGLFVTKDLDYKICSDLTFNVEDTIETSFIEIPTNTGKNVIVGEICRPRNNKNDLFENSLEKILDIIDKENKICYLMGDFNVDLFKSESYDYSNRFLEQMFTSSFFPLITKATRVTHDTTTLIDNIFTNNIGKISDSINAIIISDHLPIVHRHNTNVYHNIIKQNSNSFNYKRIINKTNRETYKNSMKNISWDNVMNETENPDKAFNEFSRLFTDLYNANFPIKQKNKTKINKNKNLSMIKSVKSKNKLYKKFLNNPSSKNELPYKRYKNKLNHVIRISKKHYYEEQLIKYKQNTKMLWQTLMNC